MIRQGQCWVLYGAPWWKSRAYFRAGGKYYIRRIALNSVTRRERHVVEYALRPYSLYRLDLVPCLRRDPWWRLEPLVFRLIWAHLREQTSMLTSPCQPPQWLPVLMVYLPAETESLYSLQGLRLSQRPREQFPSCNHVTRGNGNSHHLSGYLPQWLVPRNKAFQCGFRVVVPPLVLVVTDFCEWWTSALRAASLVICHWLLEAYFILNMSRYWGPWFITPAALESGLCQRLRNSTLQLLDTRVVGHLIQ